jgi:hypothetical protein
MLRKIECKRYRREHIPAVAIFNDSEVLVKYKQLFTQGTQTQNMFENVYQLPTTK